MNCPHCGALWVSSMATFDCGSYGRLDGIKRVDRCYERQISQLKAELAQSVRRGDPRLKEIADALGAHSNSLQVVNAKDKLQSIIEGK